MNNDTDSEVIDVFGGSASFFFAFRRRKLLEAVGNEILGPRYRKYAILEMRDVSDSTSTSIAASVVVSLLFGWLWSVTNWLAARRAYLALDQNRGLPTRIVYDTLIAKGDKVPKEVWKEFHKRNPDAFKSIAYD